MVRINGQLLTPVKSNKVVLASWYDDLRSLALGGSTLLCGTLVPATFLSTKIEQVAPHLLGLSCVSHSVQACWATSPRHF